ncbi:GNAT family N-acetyltransferase [Tomitella biformata]|uniref:GNAT family N-acetyltransferase n=1 Tax=Tomitella biformata TaxID=630403 RepID=UPI000A00C0A2|nr:GNAT family N-acetyltransferase [Tomitella biformata]
MAFDDDPAMSWMLPDPRTRLRSLERMFATQLRHHHLAGGGAEVTRDAAGRVMGAAAWDPPHGWEPSLVAKIRMLPGMTRALGRYARRGQAMDKALDSVHPNTPHWYLSAIGTDPAGRGGGFGKALLQSRMDKCDGAGLPAYLESSKHANIPFYERFGFQVVQEIALPGGPSLWTMWREPR